MHRFEGLDRLRGLALLFMILQHAVSWTAGKARFDELFGVTDGMAVTDLSAPMFALALGAAASVVGPRLRAAPAAKRWAVARRWLVIAGWGVAIGVSRDLAVDSFGVLEALAVVGIFMTLIAATCRPAGIGWTIVALAATAAAPLVVERLDPEDGALGLVLAGGFPVVTYLAFASWGAVVMSAQGRRERPGRIAALGAVAVVAVLTLGTWPPTRHPGDLLFVVPSVAATLGLWALVAAVPARRTTDALARAGRRTLLVFVAHYGVKIAFDLTGITGELQGRGWNLVAIAAGAVVFALAAWPERGETAAEGGLEGAEPGNRLATVGRVPSLR